MPDFKAVITIDGEEYICYSKGDAISCVLDGKDKHGVLYTKLLEILLASVEHAMTRGSYDLLDIENLYDVVRGDSE